MSRRPDASPTVQAAADAPHVGPGLVQQHQRIAPVHLARRLSQVMLSAIAVALPPGSARNEFGVLVAVSQTSGLDQKRLAAMMAFDTTTIGQLIDHLERKGFVRRVASPTDRRVNIIEVTDAGREEVAVNRPKVLQAQYDVLRCLSDAEQRMLIDLMARVIEANPEHDRPGAGRRPPKLPSG
jgi:DNA-binding MarR family transcriptional regulator